MGGARYRLQAHRMSEQSCAKLDLQDIKPPSRRTAIPCSGVSFPIDDKRARLEPNFVRAAQHLSDAESVSHICREFAPPQLRCRDSRAIWPSWASAGAMTLHYLGHFFNTQA